MAHGPLVSNILSYQFIYCQSNGTMANSVDSLHAVPDLGLHCLLR